VVAVDHRRFGEYAIDPRRQGFVLRRRQRSEGDARKGDEQAGGDAKVLGHGVPGKVMRRAVAHRIHATRCASLSAFRRMIAQKNVGMVSSTRNSSSTSSTCRHLSKVR